MVIDRPKHPARPSRRLPVKSPILAFLTGVAVLAAACGGGDSGSAGAGGDAAAGASGADGASLPSIQQAASTVEEAGAGTILRVDSRFDALVPRGAVIEKIADGFTFIEGPVWIPEDDRLLFSDVRENVIYEWSEADSASTFVAPFFDGSTEGRRTWGSNGLTRDADGRLIIADQGRRQITRLSLSDQAPGRPLGPHDVLASEHQGMRFNSPNDVVVRSDGWIYFTDPPYGLEGLDDSPLKELPHNGIYRLGPAGELQLLHADQNRPNGLAFSPDESTLYVANSDGTDTWWMAYDIGPGGASNSRIFFDAREMEGSGVPDGMKVDAAGNLFATGPGGVVVIAADGTHLGTIQPEELPANVGWGDDGSTLYITARTGLYRIRLATEGVIP